MSVVVIENEAWRRILADERLKRARRGLSFHEIRLIVQHVREADRAHLQTTTEQEEER